jgi:hypothetical protein
MLSHAINKKTGKLYHQDPRCEEGEMWGKVTTKCSTPDECCDDPKVPDSCDPPGTVYTEDDCKTDPNYQELPPEPPGGWPTCAARKQAGYPDPCNKQSCPTCAEFTKDKKAKGQAKGHAYAKGQAGDQAALEAELMQLQMESALIDEQAKAAAEGAAEAAPQMPTFTPPSASGPAGFFHTGKTGTGTGAEVEAQAESRIQALVAAHQEAKASQPMMRPPPRPSPPKAPPAMKTPPAMKAPPAMEPPPAKKAAGLFSWFNDLLFGAGGGAGFGGLGQTTGNKSIIPIIIVVAIIFFLVRK